MTGPKLGEVASRGISVLAIAHRLHTIRKADTIYLIEDGLCVDAGTHEELFTRSESYHTNVLSQTIVVIVALSFTFY